MLGALLANIRLPGGKWLRRQAKRDRLLKEDDDLMKLVTTLVTSDVLDG